MDRASYQVSSMLIDASKPWVEGMLTTLYRYSEGLELVSFIRVNHEGGDGHWVGTPPD